MLVGRPHLGILTGLLLASLALAWPAGAETEPWGYELANELMSPYCPGRALPECPSPQAEDLRQWILAQEKAGRSRADVEAELIANFGDQLLQAPRAEGIGLVAYLAPLALFLVGGAVVALFMRRQVKERSLAPSSAGAPLQAVDPDLERQLEEELRT